MEELIYESWIPWMNLDVWIIFVSEFMYFSGDLFVFFVRYFQGQEKRQHI